jgi:hypothetical protein
MLKGRKIFQRFDRFAHSASHNIPLPPRWGGFLFATILGLKPQAWSLALTR